MGFMSDMIVLATQDAGGGQGAGVTPGAPASADTLHGRGLQGARLPAR